VSTYDDNPGRFAAPWELPDAPLSELYALLLEALRAEGALVLEKKEPAGYVRAYMVRRAVHIEVLLQVDGDAIAEVRAVAATPSSAIGFSLLAEDPAEAALTALRRRLGWAEVAVLRNRVAALPGLAESRFDRFGPPPPEGGVDLSRSDYDIAY
jgi:hypothetical protein